MKELNIYFLCRLPQISSTQIAEKMGEERLKKKKEREGKN